MKALLIAVALTATAANAELDFGLGLEARDALERLFTCQSAKTIEDVPYDLNRQINEVLAVSQTLVVMEIATVEDFALMTIVNAEIVKCTVHYTALLEDT